MSETIPNQPKNPVSQAHPKTELRHIFIFLKRNEHKTLSSIPAIRREEAHVVRRLRRL